EAGDEAGQAGRVMGLGAQGGLVRAGVDRGVGRVLDHRGDRRGRLVDGERLAGAAGGGVVGVAVIGGLVAVAAGGEGRAGRRVGGRVRGDVDVVAADHVGVAATGRAAAVAVQHI